MNSNPIFPQYPAYDEHPANKGLDFYFDKNGISEKVLHNYLSRAQNCAFLNVCMAGHDQVMENIRMIFNTGAKMVSRALTPWVMHGGDCKLYEKCKYYIDLVHSADPEIIFESCIFETVFTSVEQIKIPPETFKAFGLPVEDRCFSYKAMLFPDGRFIDFWGPGGSIPDMTRLETQMWFYYRACLYIDYGFECLHFGQMMLVAKTDINFRIFAKIIKMIREYARDHARRGWILVNAHIYDDRIENSEELISDFHMTPTRGIPPLGAVEHLPSENNPQEIELTDGHFDSIYLDSVGGITPSGWRTSSLPYLVELDNAGTYQKEWLDKPYWPLQTEWYESGWWSFDEISWFSTQPDSYRHEWLRHAYDWVEHIDGYGHCQMPGFRIAAIRGGVDNKEVIPVDYHANNKETHKNGWGDEEVIRSIWVDHRNRNL